MKPPRPPESYWQNLVREARADAPPPVDVPRLLATVRGEALAPSPRAGWFADFVALAASRRVLAGCCAGAALAALLLVAELRDWNELLAWAQWLGVGDGGLS